MGIKNFIQIFNSTRVVKPKDLAGQTLAVDAMTELYRAVLGAQSLRVLTGPDGTPTLHINVVLSIILDFYKHGVNQIWIFDSSAANPAKHEENQRRKQKKEAAKELLSNHIEFSDSEDDQTSTIQQSKIQGLEKRTFTMTSDIINDAKFILDCFNISYVIAPVGFEGEAIASFLVTQGLANYVYSGDTDPIAFGAYKLLRRNTQDKKIYEYTQDSIQAQITAVTGQPATIKDIRRIAVISGTDLCDKTPGIGPKTILKKYSEIKLTPKQKAAIKEFAKEPDEITVIHGELTAFQDNKIDLLLDWLEHQKGFNRARVQGLIDKAFKKTKP